MSRRARRVKDLAALLYFCVFGAACGGAAQAPSTVSTVEACFRCAADLAEKYAARSSSDGGSYPAAVDGGAD